MRENTATRAVSTVANIRSDHEFSVSEPAAKGLILPENAGFLDPKPAIPCVGGLGYTVINQAVVGSGPGCGYTLQFECAGQASVTMVKMIKIWDAPTRFFHWSLVLLFAGMWFSGEQGGDWLHYHVVCGELVAVLLLFRLVWGIVGSDTARFSQFVKGPATIRRYLKGELTDAQLPGHNPLGGLMVVALLTVLLLQVISGLFSSDVDSYVFDGPLAKVIASGLSESITHFHKAWFNLILMLVAMHVAAIVAYRVLKKQNLVRPMLTGYKPVTGIPPQLFFRSWRVAVLTLLLSGGGVYLLLTRW